MPKKKTPTAVQQPNYPQLFAPTIALIENVAMQSTSTDDPFYVAWKQLFAHFFAGAQPTTEAIKVMLDTIDDGCEIERAARMAGFVLGVEYVRGRIGPGDAYRLPEGGGR